MKKPKVQNKETYFASEVKDYIKSKFQLEDTEFWRWFFSECKWGNSNLLGLDDDDYSTSAYPEYVNAIKKCKFKIDEDNCLRIERDI